MAKRKSARIGTRQPDKGTYAVVVGTRDIKGEDLRFVKGPLVPAKIPVKLVVVGTKSKDKSVDVSAAHVAANHPKGASAVTSHTDRGKAVPAMSEGFEAFVGKQNGKILGMIGLGGSGNTALVTPGMRRLPIGIPKIMVSMGEWVGNKLNQMNGPVRFLIQGVSLIDVEGAPFHDSKADAELFAALEGTVTQTKTASGSGCPTPFNDPELVDPLVLTSRILWRFDKCRGSNARSF